MQHPSESGSSRVLLVLLISAIALSLVVGVSAGILSTQLKSHAALRARVLALQLDLDNLQNQQRMPALVLDRNRNSICYIYGVYGFRVKGRDRLVHKTRFSGTGFVVGDGLLATNKHVTQPWKEDDGEQLFIRAGAKPEMQTMLAFFPGMAEPVPLTNFVVSKEADLAVGRFQLPAGKPKPAALALNEGQVNAGGAVIVVGYPMGMAAMLAKTPRPVYEKLALHEYDITTARELAQRSLIRPSATQGHLGDVVGDTLIYDAPTAHGGSGGPVFNEKGEVIGVNAAYMMGFSGSNLGVSVRALRPVIQQALKQQ